MSISTPDLKSRAQPAVADLYERDFYQWTVSQARALREGRWDEVDWGNVAEEIESVGRNDRQALRSHLVVLYAHLLKCIVQPDRWTRSWDHTIRAQRKAIVSLVRRNPSFRSMPEMHFPDDYGDAVYLAHRDTGLSETAFPPEPPFTLNDALSPTFFPGPNVEGRS